MLQAKLEGVMCMVLETFLIVDYGCKPSQKVLQPGLEQKLLPITLEWVGLT